MQKTINYVAGGIMALLILLGVIDFVLILKGSTNEFGAAAPNVPAISFGLILFYLAMFLCIGFALVSAVVHTALNIKESVGTLAGIAIFVTIVGISYSMAGTIMPEKWVVLHPDMFTPGNSKIAETCLYVMYTFLFASVFSIILGQGYTIYKKFLAK